MQLTGCRSGRGSQGANAMLLGVVNLGELHKALQDMESGKVPGIDRLPFKFYFYLFKFFWTEVGVDLLQVLNDSLCSGRLPLSYRRAVITLLPKKGDLMDIKNWPPVSLLCSDYKLLSKVLANRLSKVTDQVVHPDQTYCVPGRSIFDNIALIRDTFDVSKLLNIDIGLISIDQEKAFDRVEHAYLWRTLEAFGFCRDFIDKVKVLYGDVESVLKINGGLCTPFKVCGDVRQGCSLTRNVVFNCYRTAVASLEEKIFVVYFLTTCKNSICLSAYADDVVVLINGQNDVKVVMDVLEDFRMISSAKVNWNKSEELLIGNWLNGKPFCMDQQ